MTTATKTTSGARNVNELLKKVEKIQIIANRKVDDFLAGQYHSVFRGRGMEFDEVREYQPGDDVRAIDWNVTARAGTPFIKRFVEERELTVLFVVDISASGAFGSGPRTKLETAIEMVAVLMFSALKNNDKVGLILFCDQVVTYLPPRKGKAYLLRLIRELLTVQPVARETNVPAALDFLNQVQKRRGIVFLVSDFLGRQSPTALTVANRRHDLVALTVSDERENILPDVGILNLRDAETGEIVEVDTRNPKVRARFREAAQRRAEELTTLLRRAGVDRLAIDTRGDYVRDLRRFFDMRERRFR